MKFSETKAFHNQVTETILGREPNNLTENFIIEKK